MAPFPAALEGAKQIGFTVLSISLSLIAAFTPLIFMDGIVGRLLREFSLTLTFAIVVSTVVSLTVTPVLAYYLLPNAPATHRHDDSPLLRGLKWGAAHLIRFSMAYAFGSQCFRR
jgi:multidrug efflux pump